MYISKILSDRILCHLPMASLISTCFAQWLFLPHTGLFLVMDKLVLFYWLIYRPDRISIFGLGLLYLFPDIKEGWHLGFSVLTTLLFVWTVLLQRHVLLRHTFIFQWFAWSIIVSLYVSLVYVSYSFMAGHRLTVAPFMISWLLSLFLYPISFTVLLKIQKHVPLFFELEA